MTSSFFWSTSRQSLSVKVVVGVILADLDDKSTCLAEKLLGCSVVVTLAGTQRVLGTIIFLSSVIVATTTHLRLHLFPRSSGKTQESGINLSLPKRILNQQLPKAVANPSPSHTNPPQIRQEQRQSIYLDICLYIYYIISLELWLCDKRQPGTERDSCLLLCL